jgi:hypothetical protein
MKFIASLRDPVKRAFSHWTWYQKHSKFKTRSFEDKRTFPEAVEQELSDPDSVRGVHRYLKRGLYANQLKEWYQYFDPEQFSFLILMISRMIYELPWEL